MKQDEPTHKIEAQTLLPHIRQNKVVVSETAGMVTGTQQNRGRLPLLGMAGDDPVSC